MLNFASKYCVTLTANSKHSELARSLHNGELDPLRQQTLAWPATDGARGAQLQAWTGGGDGWHGASPGGGRIARAQVCLLRTLRSPLHGTRLRPRHAPSGGGFLARPRLHPDGQPSAVECSAAPLLSSERPAPLAAPLAAAREAQNEACSVLVGCPHSAAAGAANCRWCSCWRCQLSVVQLWRARRVSRHFRR